MPFEKLWRTGASDCTSITTNEDIVFGNTTLKMGSYSIFTIPSKKEWTIIVNTDTTLHGETGYDAKKDVFRFTVPVESIPNFYETFTIEINDINSKGEGFLKLIWENSMVKIPLKSKADETILTIIDKNIIKEQTLDANLLFQAANYYYSTNRDYKQAVAWLLKAEKLDPDNFYYPNLRQKIATELKDYPSAIEAGKKALSIAELKKMKSVESLKKQILEMEFLLNKQINFKSKIMKMKHTTEELTQELNLTMYKKLAIMIVVSFIAMYILMYSMVDVFANVIPNINQFYMAGLMTMPMHIIELLVMGSMYGNKKLNISLVVAGFIGLILFFTGIRQQAAVGDKEFLKSMIPHHAAAILMGKEASVTDPEIKELIKNIITSQQAEIEQMKVKLKELDK